MRIHSFFSWDTWDSWNKPVNIGSRVSQLAVPSGFDLGHRLGTLQTPINIGCPKCPNLSQVFLSNVALHQEVRR